MVFALHAVLLLAAAPSSLHRAAEEGRIDAVRELIAQCTAADGCIDAQRWTDGKTVTRLSIDKLPALALPPRFYP